MRDRKVIGRGRSAEILAWGDGRAMKLYLSGSRREYVQREARVSRLVHGLGLPAPAVFNADTPDGLYDVDGRFGILFERIDGATMIHDLGTRPWRLAAHSRLLARVHARIHEAPGEGLPLLRSRIEHAIERASGLVDKRVLQAARDRLQSLPELCRVCHGDFHPDNVILREGTAVVIDWGPASSGHPAADVAWTYLLFRFGGMPPDTPAPLRLLLPIVRQGSLRIYLREYFALSGRTWTDLKAWLGVIAILRLSDGIEEERARLLRFISREFAREDSAHPA